MKYQKLFSLSFLMFLLINTSLIAQTWQFKLAQTVGLPRDIAVANTENGYLYFHSNGTKPFLKVDETGTITNIFPYTLSSPFLSPTKIEANNNNYVFSSTPGTLTKMDLNGNIIWENTSLNSSNLLSPQIIGRRMTSFFKDGSNYIFAASNIVYVVDETLGTINNQFPFGTSKTCVSIQKDNNDYIVLGQSTANQNDYSLVKMDNSGVIALTQPLNMTALDFIVTTNGYLVVGNDGSGIMSIVKYDKNMVEQWTQSYGNGVLFSIIAKDNDFVVSGSDNTTGKLLKIDASGNQIWSKSYNDVIKLASRTRVIHDNDNNGFVMATTTHLLKTDENGDIHKPERDLYTNGASILDINNINPLINANGVFFWDYKDGYFKTPDANKTSTIFASGLWMGGFDSGGNLKLAAQTYNSNGSDYQAGYIGTTDDMNKVWKVSRADVKKLRRDFDNDSVINDFVPHDILTYPARYNPNAKDYNNQPMSITKDLVPFFDRNGDAVYNVYDGDYPILYGDMQLVWLMNDDKVHGQTQGSPLEFDITGILYANHCGNDSIVDNTVFMRLNISSQSIEPIDSFHLAMWTDFDLGCHLDDYIGSLPTRNSFYVYNENAIDGSAGCSGIPSFGTDVPIQTVTYLNQNLKYFTYYENGSSSPLIVDPTTSNQYYNFLTGTRLDGTPFTHNGTPVDFVYPGNPSNSNEWSMASEGTIPGDFRTLGTVEFPAINPGHNFSVELAYITHNNVPHPAPNIVPVGNQIGKVQNYYDSDELNWGVYLGGNKELTIGQPLSLTANIEGGNTNGNYTYLWSTGETTQTINATAPIEYGVTVTNTLTGCSKTDAVHVYFPTSTVEKITAIDKIAVFPNPVQDFVQIDISQLDNQSINIQLVDITGRTIKTLRNEYSDIIRLDVSNISTGVYYLSFTNADAEKIGVKKIVILD